jgi:ATP-binding cassette subfamily B protein
MSTTSPTPGPGNEPLEDEARIVAENEDHESSWRGVAADGVSEAELTEHVTGMLRSRSRRLLGDLLRPHRRWIYVLLLVVVVENAARLSIPYLVKEGIDRGIPPIRQDDDTTLLFTIVAVVVLAIAVQAVTRQTFLVLSGRIGQDILFEIRKRVYRHFQRLSPAFHDEYTSGRVISRQTSDMDALDEMLETGFDGLVTAVLTLVGTAVLLLVLDVKLGLVALLCFPFLAVLTNWFRKESARTYRVTREKVALVIVHFVESMGGIRAVQAFRRESRNQEIFDDVNDQYRRANLRAFRLVAWFMPGIKLIGNVTIAVVLLYGAYLAFEGEVTVGVLAAFLLYLRQFFEPMQEISQFYNTFQSASAALEKLSGVLEEEPGVAEPAHPVALHDVRGEVRLDHVHFSYVDGVPVLPDMDLTVPGGQTVALVGTTGAGKTTIAKLVSRFYDPTYGRVLLDGVNLRDLDEETLRRSVVMVTQENFMFGGTVADNIRFGRPDASREEVVAAARAIGAHEFIAALPNGYDTDVANRGGRLSAGQRQLVAFARAFLADPDVLILDEATSSLDVPSERLVQRALRTILADRTAIIIAHRLSTVEIADRVLVLEHGRIVEDGAPTELIELGSDAGSGRFAGLHEAWVDSLA